VTILTVYVAIPLYDFIAWDLRTIIGAGALEFSSILGATSKLLHQ
jgi:hypothetical protein